MVYIKLYVQDLLDSLKVQYDVSKQQFLFGSPIRCFQYVRVFGIVVQTQPMSFELDDGSGVITMKFCPHYLKSLQSVQNKSSIVSSGFLVECIGELRQNHTNRFVFVTGINTIENPNYEILRNLEIIDLYQNYYYSGKMDSTSSLSSIYTEDPELLFIKENDVDTCLTKVISKDGPQTMHLYMDLESFHDLELGNKRYEIRLQKHPELFLQKGDVVVFNNLITTTVQSVKSFTSLHEALNSISTCLHQLLSTHTSIQSLIRYYREYFNEEEEEKVGVLLIEFNSSKHQEEPINIENIIPLHDQLYAFMQGNGNSANLSDLNNHFKNSSHEHILRALGQLQLDGVIYESDFKYFVL